MTKSLLRATGALMLPMSLGQTPARAADPAEPFVKALVAAINSGDAERRKAMLHPATRVCADTAPDLIYHDRLARQARRKIPSGYRWNLIPLPADQPPLFADKFDYPVRPTHQLQIDFETEPTQGTSLVLQLVHESGGWHEITACPRPETVAAARAVQSQRAKYAERVKTLVATAPPALKAAVIGLYKEGRKIDAYKHYQAVTGEDLAIARDVVQALAEMP